MHSKTLARLLPLTAAFGLLASQAEAQTLKSERIISGVSSVTWVGSPPTDDRLFVTEQTQHDIHVFTSSGAPIGMFLDLSGTASGSGERGLLSMAFDPNYASNGYFYVYYTYGSNGSRIARYQVSGNPNVADPSTATTIIQLTQPFSNHNGGHLQFGDDGFLYFAWGDGGSSGDPSCNAQKGTTLLGKMIRIDVHGDDFPTSATANYAIPASNPFVGDPSFRDEIYHLGLRNPWRWTFDPATGDMYIGDVGQNAREEISFGPAGVSGLNFGWKIMEGNNCYSTSSCPGGIPGCGSPLLTDPFHELVHGGFGGPCAVIGGVVYRGCKIPELNGTYFFTDNCDNKIWTLNYSPVTGVSNLQDRTAQLAPSVGSISSVRTFGYDDNGDVLIGDSNEIFRVSAAFRSFSPDTCSISVAAGGTQSWTLQGEAAHAGQLYLIGGSLSGTAGIPSGLVVVPLTLDGYTLYSLNNPNVPPLLNSFGSLSGSATANASFSIGAGLLPVSLVGTRAYHAYAAIDSTLTANFASNAVGLDFDV